MFMTVILNGDFKKVTYILCPNRRKHEVFKRTIITILFIIVCIVFASRYDVMAAPPTKSKFYDFNEQLIDGEIKKPTALYTDSRQKVKFDRLLKLKKSFIKNLFDDARMPVFK